MLLPDDSSGLLATLTPNAKWRAKGLVAVFLGNKLVWNSRSGAIPLAPTGGPKTTPSKFGLVTGFGSTYGAGTTDHLDGGTLPSPTSGWRSVVAHYYANSTGGSGGGRIWQDTAAVGNEWLYHVSGAGMYYTRIGVSAAAQWSNGTIATGRWQSTGYTIDMRTLNAAGLGYFDGLSTSCTLVQSAVTGYRAGDTGPISWGNRATDNARNWDGLIGPVLLFDGFLSAADHATLDKKPLQVFEPDDLAIWLPFSAGGAAALAGSAAAQASASGALTTQVSIVGAATTVATASGVLTTQVPLAGQAAAVSLASGTLSITVALTGSALANALATGALSTSIALSGSALANALATGNLLAGGAGALAGNAAAQASASGALSTAIPLQGNASALAIAAGGLTTAVPLAGVAVAVETATGNLTLTFGGLSGAAVAQVLAAGTLSLQIALSGSAVAHALATGSLGTGDMPVTPQDTWDRELSALFDPFYGDFGESAVLNGATIQGIFSSRAHDSFSLVLPDTAQLRISATHAAAIGNTVTVGGIDFVISAIHDIDGTGTEKRLELNSVGGLSGGSAPNLWDRILSDEFDPFYGDFAEAAVVNGVSVQGIFSSSTADSFGFVQSSAPSLRMSATKAAAVGSVVTVGARSYQVAAIHDPDGTGTEKLLELK